MASAEQLDEVVRMIVSSYDPDEIRLFGSHAKGTQAGKSDVDLLILKETDEPFPRRVRRLEHLLHGMLLRFDINVYTREELRRAMEHPYSLMNRIVTRQARTVYSKRFPDYDTIVRAWERESGTERHRRLTADPSEWKLFQMLYEKAHTQWGIRPCDLIAERIRATRVSRVADLGCGDARLADLLAPLPVIAVDHVSAREGILAADITAPTPIEPASVDAVVLSLALIGTNWRDSLHEANRILRLGSFLFIAEPTRRAGEAAFRLLDAVTTRGFGIHEDTVVRDGIVYVTAVKLGEGEKQ